MSTRLVFIDESLRSNRYLLCGVTVSERHAGQLRREVRGLLLPGQRRLHFNTEGKRRRRKLLSQFIALESEVMLVESRVTPTQSADEARANSLATIVQHAQTHEHGATLYIERRDGLDDRDRETIIRARLREPTVNFEHLRPEGEPLLWIPDAFAWAVGARGEWFERVRHAVTIHTLP